MVTAQETLAKPGLHHPDHFDHQSMAENLSITLRQKVERHDVIPASQQNLADDIGGGAEESDSNFNLTELFNPSATRGTRSSRFLDILKKRIIGQSATNRKEG